MATHAIVLSVLGALALFLLGLEELSSALQSLGSERIRAWLLRMSRRPWLALLTGVWTTALLDSSSAVIVLLIALVDADALDFENALGIVLGANIGTTVSSQIIALNIGQAAPVLLFVGVLGRLFARSQRTELRLRVLTGVGLVFYGLEAVEAAVEPLRAAPDVLAWLQSLTEPMRGLVAGGLVTLVIQSSSATLGLAIQVCNGGMMPLTAGVSVMLGAEIGTCADTLVACSGRSRAAVRTGLFHLLFNIVSVALGAVCIGVLTAGAAALSPGASAGRQLANAHVLFNTIAALLALPLVPWAARGLRRWLPDRRPA
ncbi:phosphate:Na+ symporter [Nannocystis exedens]|uniref:Phosphate:Na+ symporter n=1 Tax=Nannocystis exedens TaxID=54 RepID=A0A1I1WLZ8_9BACT|nr:Na/Pi symporter [Nannocystis exedens]PCC67797.1 Na+/Pi-cotransporter [Nannocystis exedens]SFD95418.1 phosphate:Na+ symporter [Nannocystis exedens]